MNLTAFLQLAGDDNDDDDATHYMANLFRAASRRQGESIILEPPSPFGRLAVPPATMARFLFDVI